MTKFQDSPLTLKYVERFQPFVKKHHVSPVARSKNQFLDQLRDYGSVENLDEEWKQKRYLFLIRTTRAYQKKASHRRWLSLLTWAYFTNPTHNIPDSEKEEIEEIINEMKGIKKEDDKKEDDKKEDKQE